MGQDWRTLGLVAAVAAIAGWLVVRLMSGAPARREETPVAVAPTAVPEVEARATAASQRITGPAPARTMAPPATGDDGGDLAYIIRDLDVLSQALVRDQRIEDRLMPRINDALDVPGPMSYRREPDFWETVLGGSRGAHR